MKPTSILRVCIICYLFFLIYPAFGQGVRFIVSYPATAFTGPFSGRVIVCLSKRSAQPRFGPNWFSPEPMYSKIFKLVKPEEKMIVGNDSVGFPVKLSEIEAGEYYVQAVIDRNLGGRQFGSSQGNLYSDSMKVILLPTENKVIELICDKVVQPAKFYETPATKEVRVESKLLSKFYGRPTYLQAAVALPEEWAKEPSRTFPIVYEVPGFGGRHYDMGGVTKTPKTHRDGQPFLYAVLDPDCPTGHCVFADSANNGPWGKALTTELIPAIENQFRAVGKPEGRYITGHSSGGWSSLWLQVAYPEFFGGCWSTSPDPVDFRDFQQIDIYSPNINMFTDSSGHSRPIARRGDIPTLFYKPFSDMERPIRGEQLGSFEAVFSPKGRDGEPRKLWNRDTGAIDPSVAESWKKYDIDFILRTRWSALEPKLAGKIHIYTGDLDTFYLEGAVKLLKKDMQNIGAKMTIEIVPGDHGSMMTPALRKRIDQEMAAQLIQKGVGGRE